MAESKGFFDRIKFSFNDVKAIVGGSLLYFLLVQEIHDNKTMDVADKQIIEYRLNDLEKHCGVNQVAILPKETKIEFNNK